MYVPRAILSQIFDANWHPVAVDLSMWWHHKPGDVISASPFQELTLKDKSTNTQNGIYTQTFTNQFDFWSSKAGVHHIHKLPSSKQSMFLGLQENSLWKQGVPKLSKQVPGTWTRWHLFLQAFCKTTPSQHWSNLSKNAKTMWTKIWNETNQSTTPASIH